MANPLVRELRDQIRGVAGAFLVVGLTFHYTMETWWLGWTLPLHYLVAYALVGLGIVLVIARSVGFHESRGDGGRDGSRWTVALVFAEILLQSFVAAYVILLVLGIIDLTSSPSSVMRLGLIEVVPLGFGAALANNLFGHQSEQQGPEGEFPRNLAIFAIGSVFISSTIAPTQEMELIAAHMGWPRHAVLVALSLVLVYLILYELEFKGQQARIQRHRTYQAGTVFLVYTVGATVSFAMLLAFGHFVDGTVALVYQETVVLAFPASLGGAAAEVLI